MNRWRIFLLVALTIALGGCGAAGAPTSMTSTTTTSSTTPPSPSNAPVSPLAATPVPTPAATLASTTEKASQAPAGAIPIVMTLTNGDPRFKPDNVTAKAGTVVFFLENIPGPIGEPDHNMLIGPAIGQARARTPRMRARETATFTVDGLTPGTYVFWCSVVGLDNQDHATFGMVGTLTITP